MGILSGRYILTVSAFFIYNHYKLRKKLDTYRFIYYICFLINQK